MDFQSMEKTFVMIKPDGVKRGVTGRIFKKFEDVGLKLVAARMIRPTEQQAKGNYPGTKEWLEGMGEKTHKNYDYDEKKIAAEVGTANKLEIGEKIYEGLVKYLTSGPVIISVWEGNHAVNVVRKIAGQTSPDIANVGTVRGDLGFDTPMLAVKSGRMVFQNLVHASESVEESLREIKHWFGDNYKDLSSYSRSDYIGAFEIFE